MWETTVWIIENAPDHNSIGSASMPFRGVIHQCTQEVAELLIQLSDISEFHLIRAGGELFNLG